MKFIIFSLIAFLFFGCATSDQVNKLNSQVEQLRSEISYLRGRLDEMSENIKKINTQPLIISNPLIQPTEAIKDETKVESLKIDNLVEGQCQAITASGNQCSRKAKVGSKYCWQHIGKDSSTSVNSSTSGRTIYTGPRGGQYYYNSKGKKTYIRKKK